MIYIENDPKFVRTLEVLFHSDRITTTVPQLQYEIRTRYGPWPYGVPFPKAPARLSEKAPPSDIFLPYHLVAGTLQTFG